MPPVPPGSQHAFAKDAKSGGCPVDHGKIIQIHHAFCSSLTNKK